MRRKPQRDDRIEQIGRGKPDDRPAGARDRDRILYSSAFRRLAGVTQVITPEEGLIVHNRLTHSLKVGQVARRIAETLLRESPMEADRLGGIDPEVVEAAGFAHDLGHPPFGHIAEAELDELARGKDPDGFEGNAQSFRVVTRLALSLRRFWLEPVARDTQCHPEIPVDAAAERCAQESKMGCVSR